MFHFPRHLQCWSIAFTLLAGPLLLSSSCSKAKENTGRPKTFLTSGEVFFDGKPVEGADVTFVNDEASRSGFGKTDARGKFHLTTFDSGDGAVLGLSRVTIRKVDVVQQIPPGTDLSAGGTAPPPKIIWLVPEMYANVKTSMLTATVTDNDKNHFRFDLK